MKDDDNLYDDYEYEEDSGTEVETTKPGGNRTFVVSLGIIAFIFLISLVALAVVAAVILPQNRVKRENQQAVIYAQNTATAYAATQANLIAPARLFSATPAPPTAVPEQPTNTSVVIAATAVPQALAMGGGMDSRTATVAALLTQAALSGVTAAPAATYPVASAASLANAGFADEVGLPLLVGAAVILVIVIILARRLRAARAK